MKTLTLLTLILACLLTVLAIIAGFGWAIVYTWGQDPLMCVILWGFNLAWAIELYRGKS